MKPLRTALPAALVAALAIAGIAPAAHAAGEPALVVTEIVPDTTGYDNFEFFEITNTTDASIDLAAAGIQFSYIYADNDDRTKDVALTVPAGVVVDPGEAVVMWLNYSSTTVDAFSKTDDEFRAQFPAGAADYELVRVTGQGGMVNAGNRGIRIMDASGAAIS